MNISIAGYQLLSAAFLIGFGIVTGWRAGMALYDGIDKLINHLAGNKTP